MKERSSPATSPRRIPVSSATCTSPPKVPRSAAARHTARISMSVSNPCPGACSAHRRASVRACAAPCASRSTHRSIRWHRFGIDRGAPLGRAGALKGPVAARRTRHALVEIAQVNSAAHLRAVWSRSSPEVLEPLGRQLGIFYSVLDVPVAKVGLQGACIVALVGESEAAGVPQHVRGQVIPHGLRGYPAKPSTRSQPTSPTEKFGFHTQFQWRF